MQALPGIAGFSRISTRRTASLAVISDARFHQERPHLVVVPMRRLVFGRRRRRHELVQRFPQRRHRKPADALVEVAARVVAGGGPRPWRYSAAARSGMPSRAAARERQAAAKASNNFIDTGFSSARCSGCHCRASAKAGASGTLNASTWPSSATASSRARGARRSTPWACSEFTLHAALAQQAMQHAAFDDVDVVRRRIVHVGVGRLGRAMIAPALDLVHELMQRAAQRHVDFLQAAADREQRHAAVDRMADQRQGGGVARRIVRRARPALLALIVVRLDIGRAAGQQHAVQACRAGGRGPRSWPGLLAEFGADRRDQDRQAADGMDRRPDVLLAHRMMPAAAAVFLETGRNAHQGAQRRSIHFLAGPCNKVRLSSSLADVLAIARPLRLPAPCAVQPCMVPPAAETAKVSHDDDSSAAAPAPAPAAGSRRPAHHARPVHQGPELREPARAAEPDRADPAAALAQRPGHQPPVRRQDLRGVAVDRGQRQDAEGRAAVHARAGLCRHGDHGRGAAGRLRPAAVHRDAAPACSPSPAPSSPTPRARRVSRRSTSRRSISWRSTASSSKPTAARCRAPLPAVRSGTPRPEFEGPITTDSRGSRRSQSGSPVSPPC